MRISVCSELLVSLLQNLNIFFMRKLKASAYGSILCYIKYKYVC